MKSMYKVIISYISNDDYSNYKTERFVCVEESDKKDLKDTFAYSSNGYNSANYSFFVTAENKEDAKRIVEDRFLEVRRLKSKKFSRLWDKIETINGKEYPIYNFNDGTIINEIKA